jgi:PhoH-like ATPase
LHTRKILVVDTSVLLHDMQSVHSFPGNDVFLPLIVLDELDRFKERQDLVGSSARYVNRYLDSLRKKGEKLFDGAAIQGDQTIKVESDLNRVSVELPKGLDPSKGDNQIIAVALGLQQQNPGKVVKVVTKDINLRVKCDALGLVAEDYYKDHIVSVKESGKIYSGQTTLELYDDEIDEFYSSKRLHITDSLNPNQFVVGDAKSSPKKSFIGIYKVDAAGNGYVHPLNLNCAGFIPRSKEQNFAIQMLMDPTIPLVSISGLAGSGKTFLTLAAAMQGFAEKKYKRIIITRSIEPVGKEIGFLPGDLEDKMSPWLAPILDNFRQVYKDLSYFDTMRRKGDIEVAPLAFIRGRTFSDAFIIVDEAQNTTIHELKTIITRTGANSKIVLLGDIDQIDTPYIDSYSNGLTVAVEKLKSSPLTAHITLEKGERSELATLAGQLL